MKTVLVVDDNADSRELTATVLRNDGYAVREAHNGEEALEFLQRTSNRKPSMVFLDLMMPVMDGRTFLERLRKLHRLVTLPVVVVSASLSGAIEGARRLVSKPASPDVLRQLAREYCGPP